MQGPVARRRRWPIVAIALLLTLTAAAAAIVLSLPPLGARASGERLARMQADPHFRDGAFVNDLPPAGYTFADVRALLAGQFLGDEVRVPPAALPIVRVDAQALQLAPSSPGLRAFWIGHGSVYVELDGVRLLIDPVFSEYASPFAVGPRRFHPPPIALGELPKIDAVLITHDHYDHLDMATVAATRGSRHDVLRAPRHRRAPARLGRSRSADPRHGVVAGSAARRRAHRLDAVAPLLRARHHRPQRDAVGLVGGDRLEAPLLRQRRHRLLGSLRAHRRAPGAVRHGLRQDRRLRACAPARHPHGTGDAVRAHRDVRRTALFPVHWGTFNLAFHAGTSRSCAPRRLPRRIRRSSCRRASARWSTPTCRFPRRPGICSSLDLHRLDVDELADAVARALAAEARVLDAAEGHARVGADVVVDEGEAGV